MTTTEQELSNHFSQFGPLESVEIIIERNTGRLKIQYFMRWSPKPGQLSYQIPLPVLTTSRHIERIWLY